MPDVPEPLISDHADPADALTWHPSPDNVERSRLRRFCQRTGNASLSSLREWAADDIGRYWDAVINDLGLIFDTPYDEPVSLDRGAPWATWFDGANFNYVTNALDRHGVGPGPTHRAIVWEDESGTSRTFTYAELLSEVNRFANALEALGVGKGDRIGIFLPMLPETVIATLACGKIGAIFIPLFSGYGEEAVAARLRDCEASVLITADAFPRRGKLIRMKDVADAAMVASPTIKTCITLRRAGADVHWTSDRDNWWHDVIAGQPDTFPTAHTDANDPYMIIYTSGTTGRPKGTVHVHAGFPIKAAHDLAYCFDLQADDTLFWLSDLGWMMGPWLIAGGLMLNATLFLYEGTPDYPNPDRLWQLIDVHHVTVLGIAPTVIRALRSHGDEWLRNHSLSSLRVLGSTGEMWDPVSWRWFFENVGGGTLPIINYSGGTETGGGILGCFITEPIRSCAFCGPIPGMDAGVVDESGQPIRGAVGELVVRQPWVGMTHGFWRDPERYLDTYWSRFPDTWVHGDWTEIDDDGFWYIRGRSDDVLKVSGKRIGPAELESAAAAHPAVQESAVIGVPHDVKGETIHVFAVLRPGLSPSSDLADDIRRSIRHQLGASLQPEGVHFVHELPKTRNGKIMRRVVRAAFLGISTSEVTALENPSIVNAIAALGDEERSSSSRE